MYQKICSDLYLPVVDAAKRSPFQAAFREAMQNQHLPEDALAELQLGKLNRTLTHAVTHSPYYRKSLAGVRLPLKSVSEIENLPFTTKDVLYEHLDAIRTRRPDGREFQLTTSGSTGIAMRFTADSQQWAWSEAVQWRGRAWWNITRGDRQLVLWGRPVDDTHASGWVSALKYRLRNAVQFNTFDEFDDAKIAEVVEVLGRFRPRLVYGYGSSIGAVARYMSERNIRLSGPERPQMIEYTADHMSLAEVQTASRVMGAPVLSAYGASEAPGVAQQCWAGFSHIAVDNVLIEFLRRDGSSAQNGELADVVVTTLNNFAMPLIRYRVGDVAARLSGSCRCGITLPLMDLRIGKSVDLIQTSTHYNVSAHVLDYINIFLMRTGVRGIRQFFVEQSGLDEFRLDYVRDAPFEEASLLVFQRKMREYFGDQIAISVREVPEIPLLPSGKRRYYARSY